MKTMKTAFGVAMLVVIGWSSGFCGTSAAQSVQRAVAPSATDPAINLGTGSHIVMTPGTPTASGRLFVFLPGTNAVPRAYSFILSAAAQQGYHAIGLVYPNSPSIGSLCGTSTDANCYWKTRREVVTGDNLSPLLAIDKPNSIVNRLAKLLAYLGARYPKQGWGQFLLPDGSVNWSLVAVGGHSQGGGQAAVMTKLYSLYRACYFASPGDWSKTFKSTAAWTSYDSVTPAESQYGFTHLMDQVVSYVHVSSSWTNMGLSAFGGAVSVAGGSPPYGNSHQLTTNATPNLSTATNPYHGATVVDTATPIAADGTPVYGPVWTHMCFP